MGMFSVTPKVKPLNQAKSTTCWLAGLEMMFQWKKDRGDSTKDKSKICALIDEKTPYYADDLVLKGLAPYECADVARALGMIPTGAGDYTGAILYDLISKKGPVWCGGMWQGSAHAIVITAVDPETDKLSIVDPWKNFDLSESPRSVSWLNARGSLWKSYEGSVMYWR